MQETEGTPRDLDNGQEHRISMPSGGREATGMIARDWKSHATARARQ